VASIRIDESRWPLVVISWPAEELDDDAVEAFIAASEARLARRQIHLSLHDGVRAGGISSRHRKQLAEHARAVEPLLREYMVAAAIVSQSALVHGVVTAINWLTPPVFPQKVFSDAAEAETWLGNQLERRLRVYR